MSTLQHHLTGGSSEMSAVNQRFISKNLDFDQKTDNKKQKSAASTNFTNIMRRIPYPSPLLSPVLSSLHSPYSQTVVLAEVPNKKKQVEFASVVDVVFFDKNDESGVFTSYKLEPVDFCFKEQPKKINEPLMNSNKEMLMTFILETICWGKNHFRKKLAFVSVESVVRLEEGIVTEIGATGTRVKVY
ncbi:hypothetical protein K501DRAFT_273196 [Backusella circina FSU 941]|nr:hypothetical protein K501DRAFT_273196 [Backusella circina FSU 941]